METQKITPQANHSNFTSKWKQSKQQWESSNVLIARVSCTRGVSVSEIKFTASNKLMTFSSLRSRSAVFVKLHFLSAWKVMLKQSMCFGWTVCYSSDALQQAIWHERWFQILTTRRRRRNEIEHISDSRKKQTKKKERKTQGRKQTIKKGRAPDDSTPRDEHIGRL